MFGKDLQGIRLRDDLASNEACIYVPTKCIISRLHALQSPIGHLFESHDALFVTNFDRDSTILAVYLMYEKMKGEESFYHPYLQVLDHMDPTCYWPEEILEKSDLQSFKFSLRDSKEGYVEQWDKLKNFFAIYPDFFDPQKTNEDLYRWAIGIV